MRSAAEGDVMKNYDVRHARIAPVLLSGLVLTPHWYSRLQGVRYGSRWVHFQRRAVSRTQDDGGQQLEGPLS